MGFTDRPQVLVDWGTFSPLEFCIGVRPDLRPDAKHHLSFVLSFFQGKWAIARENVCRR